jgi:hypothetical protein
VVGEARDGWSDGGGSRIGRGCTGLSPGGTAGTFSRKAPAVTTPLTPCQMVTVYSFPVRSRSFSPAIARGDAGAS